MMRLLFSVLVIMAISIPVLAFDKESPGIVLYEGFHVPIKFVETINLNPLKEGDKVIIAVNEDTGIDDHKIFKEYTKGQAFISINKGNKEINSGELTDIYGNKHPIEIKGFHLKDFKEGNTYIIPENYVIDAFIIKKKIYHAI